MTFFLSSLAWTTLVALLTGLCTGGVLLWPGLWRQLPRHRLAGALLATLCLAWAAWHAQFLLEGSLEGLRRWLWAAVPTLAVLCYFHLDFLFARALGGLVLLLVPQVLDQAFAESVRGRAVLAVGLYACGISGMFLVATPWRFRDVLQHCEESAPWRRALLAGGGSLTLFFAFFTVFG
jgi:hypothetical protein